MAHILKQLVLGFAGFSILACSAFADDLYGSDLPKKKPALFSAYQKLLPKNFKKSPWAYTLDGVSTPVQTIKIGTTTYLGSTTCKAHECGTNFIQFMIDEKTKRVVALVESEYLTKGKRLSLGSPTADEIKALEGL